MTLKACNLEDIAELIRVAIQSYKEHYLYLWKDDGSFYMNANFNYAAIKAQIEDRNVLLYLIMEKNIPYGFLKLNINSPIQVFSAKEALEIERIYLLKAATGKGLGKTVMQAIDQIAVNYQKKIIWLKVMESSKAKKFYEKCGYKECGETSLEIDLLKEELRKQFIMIK